MNELSDRRAVAIKVVIRNHFGCHLKKSTVYALFQRLPKLGCIIDSVWEKSLSKKAFRVKEILAGPDTKPMMEDRKAGQMQGASRMEVGAISASVLKGLKCGRAGS
jgi:hypothetical protein